MLTPASHPVARLLAIACLACLAALTPAQQPSEASFIRNIDTAVQTRYDRVLGFTDVEHYSVFRGSDQTHPAAEMTVRVTYRKGVGKSYQILSQSGSKIIQSFGLQPLLEHEKAINHPGQVRQSWFTSENYVMKLNPGPPSLVNGHPCLAVSIKPRHKAPNMVRGTLWVDPTDYAILRVEGVASKSPSVFAGTTHMRRDYVRIDGFAQAVHARAQSDSFFFGRTVVLIRYSDYQIQLAPTP